jgi:hypothetical protein
MLIVCLMRSLGQILADIFASEPSEAKIPLCLKKIFVHFVFRCALCATSLRERSEVFSPADVLVDGR